jgi:hypothetical protein
MEITAGQSFAIGGHPTIEIATDSKRSLFSSIEAELQSSEVYQKVLESLKTALGEAGTKADSFLAAVGKEAIQLAFKKFAKKYRSELKALAKTNMSSNLEKSQPSDKLETKAKKEETEVEVVSSGGDEEKEKVEVEVVSSGGDEEKEKTEVEVISSGKDEESSQKSTTELANTEQTSNTVESSSTPTKGPDNNEKVEEVKKGSPKKKKKLTKAEKAALEKAQKRKEVLERIGQELRKARIGRCLSLQQLHSQTLVPLNHLKALEKGNIEKLPEDIYVRGFIYRLGNALGLDGASMAEALPVPEPLQGMIPSWSSLDSNSSLGFELRPLHLYLGYTALMAGAVGGLTAVTQHSTPGASLMPELSNGETEAIAESNREIEVTATPGLEFSDAGITVGSDMAPPEIMN